MVAFNPVPATSVMISLNCSAGHENLTETLLRLFRTSHGQLSRARARIASPDAADPQEFASFPAELGLDWVDCDVVVDVKFAAVLTGVSKSVMLDSSA